MKRFLTISMVLLMAVMTTSAALAQPPEFDDSLPPKSHGEFDDSLTPMFHGKFDEKMLANIENLRMMKLLEAVDLNEEQSEKFVPLFYGFRKDFKALIDDRKSLVDNIRDMVANNAPDGKIKGELAKLKQNRILSNERQDKFISDCESILTTPQLARLVIFQERFEREMLESLLEFRRHGGQGSRNRKDGKR